MGIESVQVMGDTVDCPGVAWIRTINKIDVEDSWNGGGKKHVFVISSNELCQDFG
jgi:hypothetical protein